MHIHRATAVLICALVAFVAPCAANPYRTVALSSDPVPGASNGETFEYLALPVLNDSGQSAFLSGDRIFSAAQPASFHAGLSAWSEASGAVSPVAAAGDPAPGLPGVTIGFFNQIGLNNDGNVALRAGFPFGPNVTGGTEFATYVETLTGLQLISRSGDPTPGIANRKFSSLDGLYFNNAGQVLFRCEIEPETGTGEDSIWFGDGAELTPIARAGSFPGTFATSDLREPVFNDSGKVALLTNAGVWAGPSGNLQPIVQRGDSLPGSTSGEVFGTFGSPSSAVINNSGHVAFVGTKGIWSDRTGALSLAAASGTAPSGVPSGVVLTGLTAPVLNNADEIAFRGTLSGSGVTSANETGIYLESSGGVAQIAREGAVAPGTPVGVSFGQFDASSYTLNALGQVAILANVTGAGITTANDGGIWATDENGTLQLIVREGDLLEVRTGEFRTIQTLLFFSGSGNADGRMSGFNELGQLAYWARFTDNSEGIFVSYAVAASIPGDYNDDGNVDSSDYIAWRKNDGTQLGYNTWRANFGVTSAPTGLTTQAVPEPANCC